MVTDEELWDILYECYTEQVFNQGAEGQLEGWSDKLVQAYIKVQTRILFNAIKSDESRYTWIIQKDKEIVKQGFQKTFRRDKSYPVDISSIPQ
ncbi:MAG TPA: hypothetical protein VE262_21585 [Blastocatellia bacterium]|nr:hypothetical protein [Blastocatellia bacterium]